MCCCQLELFLFSAAAVAASTVVVVYSIGLVWFGQIQLFEWNEVAYPILQLFIYSIRCRYTPELYFLDKFGCVAVCLFLFIFSRRPVSETVEMCMC